MNDKLFGENISEAIDVIKDWVKEAQLEKSKAPETQLDRIERKLEELERRVDGINILPQYPIYPLTPIQPFPQIGQLPEPWPPTTTWGNSFGSTIYKTEM